VHAKDNIPLILGQGWQHLEEPLSVVQDSVLRKTQKRLLLSQRFLSIFVPSLSW
jgi:hypothetical protein